MSKRFKVTLAVVAAVGLLVVSLGGVVFAAGPAAPNDYCNQAVCQLLDITPDELYSLRLEGKSLVEIAAARGVSEDALVEAIMEVKRAFIQEQVEAGIITQELAELRLQHMLEMTYQAVNRTSVGPVGGSPGGAGNGWGECGDGTGPGGMHRWGKNAH